MASKPRVRFSLFLALCLVLCSQSFSFCFKRGFISRELDSSQEYDELKDQCLALRLDNDDLRYIMLCQDCRCCLDSQRPEDTVEGYSCPSCIGLMGSSRNVFPTDT